MYKVLVLGAGLVARPVLHYLLRHFDTRVLVATLDVPRAQRIMGEHPRGKVLSLDVADRTALAPLIEECDIVISLLPAELNPSVARLAIDNGKSMVSTSYASEEMWSLDEDAKMAGVVLLNEIGLDPGIDHMSATALVRQVKSVGGRIVSFLSCCGGFPAPDANTNPWGYKFSWSPRGVILAGTRPARYRRGGKEVAIPGPELFAHHWPYEVEGQGIFEIYPNRDSIKYIAAYKLESPVHMFRGTLRYPGWCDSMYAVARLGLFDLQPKEWPPGTTFAQLLEGVVPKGKGSLMDRASAFLELPADSEAMGRLEWAGLFSDRPLPTTHAAPIDIFLDRLSRLMMYQPGERDMIALQHDITVAYPDGSHEDITARLVMAGEAWGDSAMARTVSLPAGIAARLLLHHGVTAKGVLIPVLREIYEPVLQELQGWGIRLEETHSKRFRGPFDA